MVNNPYDRERPQRATLPDSHMRDHGSYYDEVQTLLYYNSQCPICDFRCMTVTIKLLIDIEKCGNRCNGLVYTSCDECDWAYSARKFIIPYNDKPEIFWSGYVDSWNETHKKITEIHNEISYNEKLMIWEKKSNPNVAICPNCRSFNVLISSGKDTNEWYLYDCNDCECHKTNNNINTLPDELLKSLNVDKYE